MANRKLVIDLSTATENMIIWINDLIKEEVDNALCTSKDETLNALRSFKYNQEAYVQPEYDRHLPPIPTLYLQDR